MLGIIGKSMIKRQCLPLRKSVVMGSLTLKQLKCNIIHVTMVVCVKSIGNIGMVSPNLPRTFKANLFV